MIHVLLLFINETKWLNDIFFTVRKMIKFKNTTNCGLDNYILANKKPKIISFFKIILESFMNNAIN